MGFPGGPVVKNSPPNAGDIGSILGWEKSVATKTEMSGQSLALTS